MKLQKLELSKITLRAFTEVLLFLMVKFHLQKLKVFR